MGGKVIGFGGLYLRPVASHENEAGHEGAENLREDVVWDFAPGKALPDGEAQGYGGVEVATGYLSAGDDGECDAYRESPADLELSKSGVSD